MEEAEHASSQRKEAQVAMELSLPRNRGSAQAGEVSVLLVFLAAAAILPSVEGQKSSQHYQ